MKRSERSPVWYVAAFALAAAGWMVGVAVAGSAWNEVRAATISSANQALDAKGRSVAVFTDVLQTQRGIRCSWTNVVNNDRHRINVMTFPLTIEDDGATWYAIAFEPNGQNGMKVGCTTHDGRADNAQYAYAVVDGYRARRNTGALIMAVTTLAALILAAVTYVARRKALRAQ